MFRFLNAIPYIWLKNDHEKKKICKLQTTYAEDTGKPLIVINHGTSEEYGMRLLSEHLKAAFSHLEIIHFSQGCSYRWIS